jgi:hypothetical protein
MRYGFAAMLVALGLSCGSCALSTRAPVSPSTLEESNGEWISLQREPTTEALASWSFGPYIFVFSHKDALAYLDEAWPGDMGAGVVGAALLAYGQSGTTVNLNDVLGSDRRASGVVLYMVAGLLETGRASVIDSDRRFVIGSLYFVRFTEYGARGRRFQTRDGRVVLRVADEPWTTDLTRGL